MGPYLSNFMYMMGPYVSKFTIWSLFDTAIQKVLVMGLETNFMLDCRTFYSSGWETIVQGNRDDVTMTSKFRAGQNVIAVVNMY